MRTTKITILAMALVAIAGLRSDGGQGRRASPHETTDVVKVDGSDVSITYGRPYMRGRRIMGALVPYNRVWCPGADEATTLKTSKKIHVGDLTLGAGEYALWMLPTPDDWTLIINSNARAFHTYHNPATDLGRVRLQKRMLADPVDQLTFVIEKNPSGHGGVIKMTWEKTEVSTPFTIVE